ncbi:MAG: hypothetical protein D6761_09330 [Candidatus Dadabacteria bacterium]|nr:MAG: hypothetical protein D6761_09330 [Candidatus Dadabacteria bacterium]
MAPAGVTRRLSKTIRWRAPGKMFLAGEYAVTDGAHALVAAVPPWGALTTTANGPVDPVQPLYPGAARVAGAKSALDTSGFFTNKAKLGFGSSATAAVLLAAARYGCTAADTLWLRAEQTHIELVGKSGSGGDLAAIIHGGVGLYRRGDDGPFWRPLPFPATAGFAVVCAGMSADTRQWVDRLRQARQTDAWQSWRDTVDQTVCAVSEGASVGDVIAAAAEHYRALRQWLGEALYPPVFEQCHQLGASLGLPFKPSGAGGGDIAFFYVEHQDEWETLRTALDREGIGVRFVRPAVSGLARETLNDPGSIQMDPEEYHR